MPRTCGRELGDAVDFVLDGGPCRLGLESTIVDLRAGTAKLLRTGAIPAERIEAVLREPLAKSASAVRVPGQHPVHYSPNARVSLVLPHELYAEAVRLSQSGLRVGVLVPPDHSWPDHAGLGGIVPMPVPTSLEGYAACLYRFLRSFDQQGCEVILASLPDEHGLGAALRDRLLRAAGRAVQQA